jgi:acetyltransferase-like isoleucine patch superfamily enzyme
MRGLRRLVRVSRSSSDPAEGVGVPIRIGKFSYGTPTVRTYAGDRAGVTIGSYCSIADDVVFIPGGNHRVDWVSTFPLRVIFDLEGAYEDGHPASRGDIVVGNDVWIGRGATILSGVRIGDGAVIGAEAVVAKSVRPYSVVVGNPAREVRRRFSDEQVDELLRIAWWQWPDEIVRARISELNGGSIDDFLAQYGVERDGAAHSVEGTL